jgi:hypothetical protein
MPMKWWVGNQGDSLGSLMGVGMKLVFLPLPSTPPFFVGKKVNDTLKSPPIFEGFRNLLISHPFKCP